MYIYLFDPPTILNENKASNESSLTSRDIGHVINPKCIGRPCVFAY